MRHFSIFSILSIFLLAIKSEGEPNVWYCSEYTSWCYMFSAEVTSFQGAISYCRASNSNLTSITSEQEDEDFADLCGCQSCWLGFVERNEGDWYWLDGSISNFTNWDEGEPNNYNGRNEELTVMNIDIAEALMYAMNRKWHDVPIDFEWAVAVCKLQNQTVITNGFVMRNLEMQKEKCKENPYGWIVNLIFILIANCCCCGCYSFYRCKVMSRNRAAHKVVLRKQKEFLSSQHLQSIYPDVRLPQQLDQPFAQQSCQPVPRYEEPKQGLYPNLGSTNQGSPHINPAFENARQEGMAQYGNAAKHATLQPPPDSTQYNQYGDEGVTDGEMAPLAPPPYNP